MSKATLAKLLVELDQNFASLLFLWVSNEVIYKFS